MGDFSAGEMRQFGCVLLWDDLRGRRGASAGGRRGRDGERRPRAGDSVAEVGPNYTLLRSKETKAKRRKRKREDYTPPYLGTRYGTIRTFSRGYQGML